MNYVIEPSDVSFKGRLWELITEILQEKLDYAHSKLETCSSESLVRYQAEIRIIKEILNLPETRSLLTEAEKISSKGAK